MSCLGVNALYLCEVSSNVTSVMWSEVPPSLYTAFVIHLLLVEFTTKPCGQLPLLLSQLGILKTLSDQMHD